MPRNNEENCNSQKQNNSGEHANNNTHERVIFLSRSRQRWFCSTRWWLLVVALDVDITLQWYFQRCWFRREVSVSYACWKLNGIGKERSAELWSKLIPDFVPDSKQCNQFTTFRHDWTVLIRQYGYPFPFRWHGRSARNHQWLQQRVEFAFINVNPSTQEFQIVGPG